MRRLIACLLVLILGLAAGCSESPEEEQRDALGIALNKGKWDQGENKTTVDGKPYAVVGTDSLKCYAKFGFIPGTGDTPAELEETASFTLVGVTADFDGNGLIPLASLPGPLRAKAKALSKKDFEKIVKKTRSSNDDLKDICGDK